ncbi:outer membrane beta-barrel protein [Steroidobacter sp. S1-65]|uniref:Outer membrane beta-barrel protein n=1 Tax=Steroidobacter gossypii TaxID=2805490 RepID=A0ABS1WWV7_9GAMM|nr:outer membrane beta-barrel protein [Steroidobacter gossypii]MBM0105466.1 outer membrane beta-barrel protein [Steroidobacter gossypii]
MHSIRTMLCALSIALGAGAASTAAAEDAASRWSFGSQLGQVQSSSGSVPASSELSTMSYDVSATWGDDKRLGWRVFTGYQFTDLLAVHVGYTDLGKRTAHFSGPIPERLLNSERQLTQKIRGVDVGMQVKLPLSERVAVAFRGGKYFWKSSTRVSETWEFESARTSRSGTDNFYGAGLEVGVMDDLTATAGWTRYRVGGDPVALWTVGVLYGFGYF